MPLAEIKFKPFLSITDKPLKGSLTVITIHDTYLETNDHYSFEELSEVTNDYTAIQVDSFGFYLKKDIYDLGYYFNTKQNGYFLSINETAWGFTEREEGLNIYNKIKEWILCK